jgi:hypothetical protein
VILFILRCNKSSNPEPKQEPVPETHIKFQVDASLREKVLWKYSAKDVSHKTFFITLNFDNATGGKIRVVKCELGRLEGEYGYSINRSPFVPQTKPPREMKVVSEYADGADIYVEPGQRVILGAYGTAPPQSEEEIRYIGYVYVHYYTKEQKTEPIVLSQHIEFTVRPSDFEAYDEGQ